MRRPLVAGAAVIAAYAAVAGLTFAWSGRRVRPLFEGFSPTIAYQWVKPPPEFAATNVRPKPYDADITLAGGQSPATVAASPDGQFIVNVSARALAAHAGDTKVHVHIAALDPATLGPTPVGRHPDGNAYLIALTYQPSGVAVASLASPADVIMTAPGTTAALLYSLDGGHTWTEIAAQQVGGPSTIGGTYAGNGYYLAAFSGTSPVNAAKSGGGVWTVVIATGVGAAAVALGAFGLVRQGRRRSAATRARARRRRPPPKR